MFTLICLVIAFCLLAFILREKTILMFIAVRPVLDYWRDWVVFGTDKINLNLNAAMALLLLVWVSYWAIKNRHYVRSIPGWFWLALTAVIMLLSVLWSFSSFTSLIEAIKFVDLVLLFFLGFVFIQQGKITIHEALFATVLSAIIPILAGLSQIITGSGITTFDLRGRAYGTFGHPNVFAFFLLSLIFLMVQYAIFDARAFWQKHRYLKTASFVVLFCLLILTYTRAAIIGLAVFGITLGVMKYRKALGIGLALVALFYLIFYPLNNFLVHRFNYSLQSNPLISRLTERSDEADSISWRISLIQETAPIIMTRPIFGFGFGTFPIVWEANRGARHMFDDSSESHNDYLRLLLETGAIGLLAYLMFFASLFTKIVQRMKTRACQENHLMLLGWVCAFVIVSVSDNMLHHTAVMWLTWFWWGVIIGSYQKQCASPNFLPLTEK
ncbi:MAG: O-antigen ligase family protein [Patescibacteria group bacterium]